MTRDEIRTLSKLLFGNADRLEVAAAVGRQAGKRVSVKLLAAESGLDQNRTQEQLARFKEAGLLVPEFDANSRIKDYRAADICYWRMAADLLSQLEDTEEIL